VTNIAANAAVINIGGYKTGWSGLEKLLQKQQAGELFSNKIYTVSIFVSQQSLFEKGYIKDFRNKILSLQPHTDAGRIRWVGLAEVIDIWKNEYNSQPNQLPYLP